MGDFTALVIQDTPSPRLMTNMTYLLIALGVFAAIQVCTVAVIVHAKWRAKRTTPAEPLIETRVKEVA